MDFIILKVNGEDVQNCSHEEAMEVFQNAPDPIIVVEVMRRPQSSNLTSSNSAKTPTVFPTPQVGGGGGLLQCGSSAESQISSIQSATKRTIAVQTVLSAGEMAASLALAAASLAQQEARLALLGENGPYCTSGKLPVDYLYGLPGARDCVEDEVCLEEEENGGDVDDAVFGIDEVGCLDYLLKRYPYNGSNPGSFLHPNAACGPVMDSVYANFPDNPNSTSSGFGNLPAGDYASTSSEKCFEVILQKQSSADKFGLTLCYRPSDVQQDVTEVFISEIEPGSVAHRSGQIMLGDRLLKIGDQEITSREHVMDLFQGCGLCAKITLARQQHHWKQVPNRLPPSYSAPSYPDSTLDIGISNVAYAHLPDQDSGMGRTTDDSVRTEESSEQEVDEHKALLMHAWNLFDPTGGINSGSGGIPVSSAATVANGHPHAFLSSSTSAANSNHLDDELIHLSQLMQSLAMHCHKLAVEKMCGTRGEGDKGGGVSGISVSTSDMPPAPPTESGVTESSSTDLAGDGDSLSPAKARQTPRMGLGATSNKASSANSLSKFKGSSDVSAVSGSDFYEAVVMPKQSDDPLTLCLTQRQPHPNSNLLPQFDPDHQVPLTKGQVSMPHTNPSSIWSIAETDKETPPGQASSSRFNVAAQFLNHGSRSSNVGSTSSCERQVISTSLGEIPGCKPPIPPSNGGSLSGSKLSCGSLNSGNSSLPVSGNTPNSTPNRVGPGTYENHATTNPAYIMGPVCSSSMFLPIPHGFFQSPTPPYEFYDRYFKDGLPHLHNPHLHLPQPPIPCTPGLVPNFRYPPPLRPQTWMCSGKVPPDPTDDRRKDDTTSSNIYETPYAEVDIVNSPSKSPIRDTTGGSGNDNGSICFTSYGVINSPYASNSGQSNRFPGLSNGGDSQNRTQGNNRPLMEWVVKKRTDGTRYITRRPVRSRQTKDRSSHRHPEAEDDEKGDGGGRHHSKGDRRQPPEQGVDRAASRHRRRGAPTRQSSGTNQPTQPPINGRGLVSLTTV